MLATARNFSPEGRNLTRKGVRLRRSVDFSLTEPQVRLQAAAKTFSEREVEPRAVAIDRDGRMPDDLLPKLGAQGFLGLTVPKAYGGSELGHLSCSLVIEQLAHSGTGAWWLVGFNNSIPATIAEYASEGTKRRCLPFLCQGKTYASIQFTEEATGSDPDALTTSAALQGEHYVINGDKRFSTLGARDGVAMLFAKDVAGGCTALVIDKNVPGYSAGKIWETVGGGGIEPADVHFDNYRASKSNLLGKPGLGFDVLLDWVAAEKVQQCAANVGFAQAALDEAVRYANQRQSRGRPISAMQGIRWMLAEMQSKVTASRWLAYRAAALLDQHTSERQTEAALAKLFVVPATIEVTELSRRIHGAYGYTKDQKIERLCRAAIGALGVATTLEVNKSIVGAELVREKKP